MSIFYWPCTDLFNLEFVVETDSREIVKNAAKIVGSISDKEFNITFNPDVYQPHVNHSEPDGESLKRDKKLIRDAAEFLLLHQIPAFVSFQSDDVCLFYYYDRIRMAIHLEIMEKSGENIWWKSSGN